MSRQLPRFANALAILLLLQILGPTLTAPPAEAAALVSNRSAPPPQASTPSHVSTKAKQAKIAASVSKVQAQFIKNGGQQDSQSIFYAQAGKVAEWFTATGVRFSLPEPVTASAADPARPMNPIAADRPSLKRVTASPTAPARVWGWG